MYKPQKLQEVQEPKQSAFNPKLKPMELQELTEDYERYQYNRGEHSFKLSKDDNGECISIYEYNRLSAGIEIGKIPPECVETVDEYPTTDTASNLKKPF